MKLPSLTQASRDAWATFLRFPIVLLDAVVTTAVALILADHEGPAQPTILFGILLAGILGIPLLLAFALVAEKRRLHAGPSFALQFLGFLLLVGYGCTVPLDLSHAPHVTLFRFGLLVPALLLLVAVAPFAGKGEVNGFWQYSKALSVRVFTSAVYSMVLYVGVAIALAALENLFNVHVPEKRYFELFIFLAGVFTTWFFLAGIPADLSQLETLTAYPKSLKVFGQYILLPVVLLYLVILYAYLVKIIIAWDWPQGWVSKLILGFSGTGLLLLLLLHPLAQKPEHGWITKTRWWFFAVLAPTVVMLFLAVWRRVSEYGVTEGRYLAVALGVWLVFLIVYFMVKTARNMKVIPASLCVLVFIVSFGPWGAFVVSRQSQIARLESCAMRAGILEGGKIRATHGAVSGEDARQISSVLSYLQENHGFAEIQKWFAEPLTVDSGAAAGAFKSPSDVAKLMGVEYTERWNIAPGAILTLTPKGSFGLAGYDRMAHLLAYRWESIRNEHELDGGSFRLTDGMDTLLFFSAHRGAPLLTVDLKSYATGLHRRYAMATTTRIPSDSLILNASAPGFRVRICPWQIQVREQTGETKIVMISADLLYSVASDSLPPLVKKP
jgi:hypothetical protein